ncbi:hypothetical protein GCM10023196_078420 [Actinoallomurus vinaceus]|uniref:Uncharacterized protein n=2 Tax=Actinoallomurus vinaceus TaxID=1080074 RepID=A0ABP8UP79_9ACTN
MGDAVDELYGVFGLIRRPARVEGCSHCVGPDEDRRLLDRPLRSLPPEDLARYAAKALNTWGGAEEFRYFVPRLLECAAADAFGYPDPEIVFGKLVTAEWRTWVADERAAVEAFLRAWWAEALEDHPVRPGIATRLSCLATTGVGLDPFLSAWGRLATTAAIRHLREFVIDDVEWWPDPRLIVFWDRHGPGYRQVITWLTDGRLVAAVEAAFEGETRDDVLELLAEIHTALAPG